MSPTQIFSPAATPARWIYELSQLILSVTGAIFLVVAALLCYCLWKYRRRTAADDWKEPPQVYGSTQIELAWTIIPVLIVLVLFLSSARVIAATQRADPGRNTLQVDVETPVLVGVPLSGPGHRHRQRTPRPGERPGAAHSDRAQSLLGGHRPQLLGPTPRGEDRPHPQSPQHHVMWIDPAEPGLYLGQCAQYCGTQHAKMLLRVYVDTPHDFARWVEVQKRPAEVADLRS